ncbi:hypothetical protein [Novosphingobium sp.]|uniref:hypothetical protein n=1 Tax=Novosphingobium sp. TaxID=1874826 RepID=UPI0035628BD3
MSAPQNMSGFKTAAGFDCNPDKVGTGINALHAVAMLCAEASNGARDQGSLHMVPPDHLASLLCILVEYLNEANGYA